MRVTVRPLPTEGRTAAFLGGVCGFTLAAEASPRSVRVGQELEYRITATGPAAWGMTGRPELKRFDRLGIGVRTKPVESIKEPPSRTFVYTLRPMRPGEPVLPPVAIAAFDPSANRYITKLTPSVPIRVVAVPAFDPATIPDLGSAGGLDAFRSAVIQRATAVGSAVLLLGSALAIAWVRARRRLAGQLGGPAAGAASPHGWPAASPTARRGLRSRSPFGFNSALIRYLKIGVGRPTAR